MCLKKPLAVFTLGSVQGEPHAAVCIQLAKLINRGGLSLPFSNGEIQAPSLTKRKGELRDEMPDEEEQQPPEPGSSRAHRQPRPEEMQGILEAGVQLQDLPARALPVPGVVDDVGRPPELLLQGQLGADPSFGLGRAQPAPLHQPRQLRRGVTAGRARGELGRQGTGICLPRAVTGIKWE